MDLDIGNITNSTYVGKGCQQRKMIIDRLAGKQKITSFSEIRARSPPFLETGKASRFTLDILRRSGGLII